MAGRFGFDLRSMEIFVETLERGSQTAAAEYLGIKQSSVSQALATLEEGVGALLFVRNRRPLEPTAAGRFFLDRAHTLLEEARRTHSELASGSFNRLHQVRLALVDSLASAVGKPMLQAIRRHTADYTLTTGLSHMHGHSLLTRHVDIIISDDRLEDYDSLERHDILCEPFVLVLPPHWDSHTQIDSLATLARQLDFVRYTPQALIGQAIERYLRLVGCELPQRLALDNTFAVLRMVADGAGWTITTPLCLHQAGIRHLGLTVLPLPTVATVPGIMQRHLSLVARRDELGDLPRQLAEEAREVLRRDYLALIARELPWLMEHIVIRSPSLTGASTVPMAH
ncbi:LysR family transcriptional regulator [Cobetia sp. QF-1]|uniref:LysR family transcriptional regulator n=1 Tax=Cobetia sp. QF-1 TaxID=1969833 RepID=UPI000B549251|nr:LysR family transcriptional regulator [Cobetia sp. QF-1]